MSVGFGATTKVMAAHYAGKPAALAGANHVDVFGVFENVYQNLVARFQFPSLTIRGWTLDRNFAHQLDGRNVVLGEVAGHRLVDLATLHKLNQADLRGAVTVAGQRLQLGHYAGTRLQYGDRVHFTLVVEQLRHPDLLAQNPCHRHGALLTSRMP